MKLYKLYREWMMNNCLNIIERCDVKIKYYKDTKKKWMKRFNELNKELSIEESIDYGKKKGYIEDL